jgi:hypothetical protein
VATPMGGVPTSRSAGARLRQSVAEAPFPRFIHSLSVPLDGWGYPGGHSHGMAQLLTRGSMKAQRAGAAGKGRDGISGRDSARAASGHQGALVVGGGWEAGLRVGGGLPGAGCL